MTMTRDEKMAAFKADLKAVMQKYNFGKHEDDNYDGEDNYCGTDYYFVIDGDTWYEQTISKVLDEVLDNN